MFQWIVRSGVFTAVATMSAVRWNVTPLTSAVRFSSIWRNLLLSYLGQVSLKMDKPGFSAMQVPIYKIYGVKQHTAIVSTVTSVL